MGADQQFCLRWNNFHTNITSAFESLRDDEDFVDITLACEGRQVKAHKMVLSACSPYFRSLLKGNPCQHPIVFLKDVTFANLASILDFMYHGEVNVSHNELATFLKTAEALKVRGLAEDDKKKDSDGYIEASSPGPPRDPPDQGASPRPDDPSATDTRLSDSPPPHKKQRRRSGTSVQSAEDTNETVLSGDLKETSVKNEPQEFNDEDDMLGHGMADGGAAPAADIKADTSVNDDSDERNNFGISESVTISRSQAAMQQLQESFGSFLPAMSQSSGFLPHGATEMPRPPFPLEGVQGLPPGISALPGPSMSQAGASQDTSQGDATTTLPAAAKQEEVEVEADVLPAPPSPPSSGRLLREPPYSKPPSTGRQHHQQHHFLPPHHHHHHKQSKPQPDVCSFSAVRPFEEALLPREKGVPEGGAAPSGSFGHGFGGDGDGLGSIGTGGFHRAPQKTLTGDEVQCSVCGRMLCNKYVLKVHMRDVHTPRSMHQCPLCGRCYSTINSLRVHISTIHKSVGN